MHFLCSAPPSSTLASGSRHWTDVRYGGWRHSLDWVVAFVSLGLHLHALTLEAPPWRLRAGWACIVHGREGRIFTALHPCVLVSAWHFLSQ